MSTTTSTSANKLVPNDRNKDGSFKPWKLVELTLNACVSFNPGQKTVDSHGEEVLTENRVLNEDDATFILQVLYGVNRYRRFLDFLLNAFYYHNSGTAIRGDRPMYAVYAYLALFRLEELGFPQFRRLILLQDAQKMVVFLRFLFDEENLKTYCRDEWIKLYDKEFVDGLIATALKWAESDLEALMVSLEEKVYLTSEKSQRVFEVHHTEKKTVPAPFNLTEPKPKPPPPDPEIPQAPKPKPPPPRLEGPTREELKLEAAKTQNRKHIETKYSDPKDRIRLKVLERPSNIDSVREELAAKEEAEKKAFEERVKAKKAPKAPTAQVKLNAAAILREDALYKRKQEQEAEAIQRYEQDLRDDTEFSRWKAKMLAADEAELQAEIDRRRKEMAASAAAAIHAREAKVEENLESGRRQKEERAMLEKKRQRELDLLVEMKQQRRNEVQADREKVKEAHDKILQGRKVRAHGIRQDEAKHSKQLAEEKSREKQRKMDIIRQLRALEKVPREKVTEFDPTWTPGRGLSCEMSLSELKERLAMAKRQQQEEQETRQRWIEQCRQEKEAKLATKAEHLSQIRKVAAAQANSRKLQAKQVQMKAAEDARKHNEDSVLKLDEKLQAKRARIAAEKARIAAEEKRVKFEQMQLAAGASAVEEKRFGELRKGAMREAKVSQTQKLRRQEILFKTKEKEVRIQKDNQKATQKNKRDFLKAYDEKVSQLTLQERNRVEIELQAKRDLVTSQRAFESHLIAEQHEKTWKPGDRSKSGYKTISERLEEQAEQLMANCEI